MQTALWILASITVLYFAVRFGIAWLVPNYRKDQ
jgi:hypothetical protein